MQKKERIYEKKTEKRKSKSLSFRTPEDLAAQIDEKAARGGLSRSEYICTACQQCQIVVVPEGKEILQTVQEIRNIFRTYPKSPIITEINGSLGETVNHLRNIINSETKGQ